MNAQAYCFTQQLLIAVIRNNEFEFREVERQNTPSPVSKTKASPTPRANPAAVAEADEEDSCLECHSPINGQHHRSCSRYVKKPLANVAPLCPMPITPIRKAKGRWRKRPDGLRDANGR